MPDPINERRSNSDLQLLHQAIERSRQECLEQHLESQKSLQGMHSTFSTEIKGVKSSLERIGSKLDTTAERVASTESTTDSLRKQNAEKFHRIGEIEGDMKVLTGRSKQMETDLRTISQMGTKANPVSVSFASSVNFRWMVGGVVCVFVILAMAMGVMTIEDAKEFIPAAGGGE